MSNRDVEVLADQKQKYEINIKTIGVPVIKGPIILTTDEAGVGARKED